MPPSVPRYFRRSRATAPLKRPQRRKFRPRIPHFRRSRATAPLKLGGQQSGGLAGCPKFVEDYTTGRRLIPYESTYGMIEVKSTLGKAALADALKKTKCLRELGPASGIPVDNEWENLTVKAVKVDRDDRFGRPKGYSRELRDEDWTQYKVQVRKKRLTKTRPFTFVWAYRLGNEFEDLKVVRDALLNEPDHPEGIFVIDRGMILGLTGDVIRRYKAIKQGKPLDPGEWDLDALSADLQNMDGNPRFLVEELPKKELSLLCFYAFLVTFLENQTIVPSKPADYVAAWQRST